MRTVSVWICFLLLLAGCSPKGTEIVLDSSSFSTLFVATNSVSFTRIVDPKDGMWRQMTIYVTNTADKAITINSLGKPYELGPNKTGVLLLEEKDGKVFSTKFAVFTP